MNTNLYHYSNKDVVEAYTNLDNYKQFNPLFSFPYLKRIKAHIIKRIQEREYFNMINSFDERHLYHCTLYDKNIVLEHPYTTIHINRIVESVKRNRKLYLLTKIEIVSFYALILIVGCSVSYIVVKALLLIF